MDSFTARFLAKGGSFDVKPKPKSKPKSKSKRKKQPVDLAKFFK